MQFGNDLIHCVTFLMHGESLFRAVRPIKIFTLTMVQFDGGKSLHQIISPKLPALLPKDSVLTPSC